MMIRRLFSRPLTFWPFGRATSAVTAPAAVAVEALEPTNQPEVPAIVVTAPVPPPIADADVGGETRWAFKGCILDRLEEYFVCMRRLKKHDPDSYDLFSRVGCVVPADKWLWGQASHHRVHKLIGFGGVSFPETDEGDEDGIRPSFILFRKMEKPAATVQSFHGPVYEVTVIYDDRKMASRWKSKLCMPVSCHVGVSAAGNVCLLKEFSQSAQTIRPKSKHGRRERSFTIVHSNWTFPWFLRESALRGKRGETPEDRARELFFMAYLTYVDSVSDILVTAEHDGVKAAFGIGLKRAPYFFADRDLAATDGARTKIFHAVRQHDRRSKDGKTIAVKAHYRGAREFIWNGYDMRITWPEVNKAVLLSDGAAGTDASAIEAGDEGKFTDSRAFGRMVGGALERRPAGKRRA